jgi:hypothetical protein
MYSISAILKTASSAIQDTSVSHWSEMVNDKFGLISMFGPGVIGGHIILRQVYYIFKPLPPSLIRDCGIKKLLIRSDMGPNKPYYPNHGYYCDDLVALNADIFYHPDLPDDFIDHRGYFLTRPQQTLIHEFGHAYDAAHGDLSLKPEWLKLSKWNETYKPGLRHLIIREPGAPEVVGEWFYDPKAGFTRFYAKRNPWDDWADSFAFFLCDMKSKLPANKVAYFNALFNKYYSS